MEHFTKNEQTTVKILTVRAGEMTSLQTHKNRAEFWHILSGEGTVTVGESQFRCVPGDEYFIPSGAKHRGAGGATNLAFLEISFGEFDETDLVRLEDKYGRATSLSSN